MIKRDNETDDPTPEPSTYFQHAIAQQSLEDGGGRFAAEMSGRRKSVEYPRLPANSPWSADPGLEPPLGFDVSAVEPVGEAFEVQQSLNELRGKK